MAENVMSICIDLSSFHGKQWKLGTKKELTCLAWRKALRTRGSGKNVSIRILCPFPGATLRMVPWQWPRVFMSQSLPMCLAL